MDFFESLGVLVAGATCIALAPVIAEVATVAVVATAIETVLVTTGTALVAKGTNEMTK